MSNEAPIKATADIKEFEKALFRFQVATQIGWAEVLKMQARLLVVRLIEWTVPHGMGKDAQAEGKAAVAADVHRVFTDFRNFQFHEESVQKAWDEEDQETLDRIFRHSPALSSFKLLDQPDPKVHQRKRYMGRVPKNAVPQHVIMDGRKSGESKIAAYIREVQKRVGKAKAGWLVAARFLAASFPAWITKSGGELLGKVEDHTAKTENPTLTISNLVEHASYVLPPSKIGELLATRIRDMEANARRYIEAKKRSSGL